MAGNAPKRYLLDTSAIFAFLEDEVGGGRVEAILRKERVLLPFVVLIEVYYITLQDQGQEVADCRHAILRSLGVEALNSVSEATLLQAARFKAAQHLSFADALIAAFAAEHGAILVHKDPEYTALGRELLLEKL